MNATPKITCPLCKGTGNRPQWPKCPECDGTGMVIDHFTLAGVPTIETDEETAAAAECRPLAEVQAETARAKRWIANHQNVINQAQLDAQELLEECLAEGRPFVLAQSDDWDATAFGEMGLQGSEANEFWPVYSDALRKAIRSMGGKA